MGILSTNDEGHQESIVYFLSEALRAAIEAGDRLQLSVCDMPQLAPGMDCSEIASKLASFRQYTHSLWSCEVMMLAKILRARDLAKELRLYEPELRPEIDTFRLATVNSSDLQDTLLPDAQNVFNGAVQPKRFLEARGFLGFDGVGKNDPLLGYKVAGRVDVRLLLDACEALHFGLAARYGFDALPSRVLIGHAGGEEVSLLGDDTEEPFLLTELSEIVGEDGSALPFDWNSLPVNGQVLRH
ncbi:MULTISPECIES: hypothetical protein [Rhodomicrobium]|uniref:hypothetical protein n=1 Tax=Rhodomicrobium TaxID=1068 RepID=UPI000B4BB083|nr:MULTISPECIES: hypothetical protein [Rhodomicrobium]